MRLAIFIPAYEAESTIADVIVRIPAAVYESVGEILVQDDGSRDGTVRVAMSMAVKYPKVTVIENRVNLGYGGTLKKAHAYLTSRGYDAYAMLHGDLQYNPEDLAKVFEPLVSGQADIVLGSRMQPSSGATGMPFYKRIGNRFLTAQMNRGLHVRLTDWHTGSVALNCKSVQALRYETMGDGHEITAQLLIRAVTLGLRVTEVAVSTNYNDGSRSCSAVTSVRYGLRVLAMLRRADAQSAGRRALQPANPHGGEHAAT